MLEHCRVCGECREAFDFAAATIAKTAGGCGVPAGIEADPAGKIEEAAPRASAWTHPVKRNRRSLILIGVVVLALGLSGVGKGRADADAPVEPAVEIVWRRLLREGTPVVQSPAGTFDARPRVVTALLPPGSGSLGVTVLDQAGKVVFQVAAKPGERGCFVEEGDIPAKGGAFRAARLLVPFPDAGVLKLDPGRPYGVVVSVAGGHASSSSVFQVSKGEGALQGAGGEER
jgi:hypothetical protein